MFILVSFVTNLRKLNVDFKQLFLLLSLLLANAGMRLNKYGRYFLVANSAHEQGLPSGLIILRDLAI